MLVLNIIYVTVIIQDFSLVFEMYNFLNLFIRSNTRLTRHIEFIILLFYRERVTSDQRAMSG